MLLHALLFHPYFVIIVREPLIDFNDYYRDTPSSNKQSKFIHIDKHCAICLLLCNFMHIQINMSMRQKCVLHGSVAYPGFYVEGCSTVDNFQPRPLFSNHTHCRARAKNSARAVAAHRSDS